MISVTRVRAGTSTLMSEVRSRYRRRSLTTSTCVAFTARRSESVLQLDLRIHGKQVPGDSAEESLCLSATSDRLWMTRDSNGRALAKSTPYIFVGDVGTGRNQLKYLPPVTAVLRRQALRTYSTSPASPARPHHTPRQQKAVHICSYGIQHCVRPAPGVISMRGSNRIRGIAAQQMIPGSKH